ncbi:MAG TPA: divalent-cation tolerance protein CutA [Chthoniobacterales bacterium]|nr:divalent-cation tolerance protein CutA [Chthoniobacterales bacterium]
MSIEVLVVFCTFPGRETAHRISRAAVEQRYAACASLVPSVKSIYRWRGQVEQADETLVVYKTSAACYPDLEGCDCPVTLSAFRAETVERRRLASLTRNLSRHC